MPLYEYRCNDCTATFEVLRSMGQRELAAVCPACESRSSMPLISRVAAARPAASASVAPDSTVPGGCCGGSCACGSS